MATAQKDAWAKAPAKKKSGTGSSTSPSKSLADRLKAKPSVGTRVGIYGKGGVGKTTLASLVTHVGRRPLFVDLEHGAGYVDVARISDVADYADLKSVLDGALSFDDYDCVIVDSMSQVEDMCTDYVLQEVPNSKGQTVQRIEDYGYGAGYRHIFDAFLKFLGWLDRYVAAGKDVVLVAHQIRDTCVRPTSEDFNQVQPRLQGGKASIRDAWTEWLDHLFWVDEDIAVTEDGKGLGGGTRSIYVGGGTPGAWAKTRKPSLRGLVPFSDPVKDPKEAAEIWRQLWG